MNVLIVGLGLIGGSLALALQGFEGAAITGADISPAALKVAKQRDMCSRLVQDATPLLAQADVVFLCQHPRAIMSFLEQNAARFKSGSLVCDVCGVKSAVMQKAALLPRDVDYVSCHPMAGREVSGGENADSRLFCGAHFVITPRQRTSLEHLCLLRRITEYIGCADMVEAAAKRHDEAVAYTSQLMHVVACAVCGDPKLLSYRGFEGGAFRDCTRVANLDEGLWPELFFLNAPALCSAISRLESELREYREAIEANDTAALGQKLSHAARQKREMGGL